MACVQKPSKYLAKAIKSSWINLKVLRHAIHGRCAEWKLIWTLGYISIITSGWIFIFIFSFSVRLLRDCEWEKLEIFWWYFSTENWTNMQMGFIFQLIFEPTDRNWKHLSIENVLLSIWFQNTLNGVWRPSSVVSNLGISFEAVNHHHTIVAQMFLSIPFNVWIFHKMCINSSSRNNNAMAIASMIYL